MNISQKAKNIGESMTLAISARAKEMAKKGMDVVSFGAGEPDFDTPEEIKKAAIEAIKIGFTKYTAASGMEELKKAVIEKFKKDNNINYNKDEIIISNGAKHSLYNVFQVLLNPGDEVIIPSPYWVSYPEAVKLAEGNPVFVKTIEEEKFKINEESFSSSISDKTKAIIINNPANPTGTVYNKKELGKLADIALKNNIYIISDEIYEKIIYDSAKHISMASLGEDIKNISIVINGMSKAYAMTGWRIGFAAANKKIVKAMSNLQSHATSNPNSIAQYASVKGLQLSEDIINKMVKSFDERRRYIYNRIESIDNLSCFYPRGAFYIFINIKKNIGKKYNKIVIDSSMSFANILLDEYKTAIIPGIAFGCDDYVRLSYATSMEEIKKGIDRLEQFIKNIA